jgi:hypothetical protein
MTDIMRAHAELVLRLDRYFAAEPAAISVNTEIAGTLSREDVRSLMNLAEERVRRDYVQLMLDVEARMDLALEAWREGDRERVQENLTLALQDLNSIQFGRLLPEYQTRLAQKALVRLRITTPDTKAGPAIYRQGMDLVGRLGNLMMEAGL